MQNMMRATNEGGRNWKDHLPWILMAYRATPHRVTRETPSMILYGKEMRLPAQLGTEEPPPSTLLSADPEGHGCKRASRRWLRCWRPNSPTSRLSWRPLEGALEATLLELGVDARLLHLARAVHVVVSGIARDRTARADPFRAPHLESSSCGGRRSRTY